MLYRPRLTVKTILRTKRAKCDSLPIVPRVNLTSLPSLQGLNRTAFSFSDVAFFFSTAAEVKSVKISSTLSLPNSRLAMDLMVVIGTFILAICLYFWTYSSSFSCKGERTIFLPCSLKSGFERKAGSTPSLRAACSTALSGTPLLSIMRYFFKKRRCACSDKLLFLSSLSSVVVENRSFSSSPEMIAWISSLAGFFQLMSPLSCTKGATPGFVPKSGFFFQPAGIVAFCIFFKMRMCL
mmetsp:Transcript_19255/g.28224  ORF Transcript_19255/g.28224 Transcript_19255/m.28224 type:complete len:238 (+) Transcript_19255:1971-2684(+)